MPVEFVNAADGPSVNLLNALVVSAEEGGFRGLSLTFTDTPQPLALMVLTVTLTSSNGESADIIVNVDKTFNPQPLKQSQPVMVNVSATTVPVAVRVRVDYLHFFGEAPSGLYPDKILQRKHEEKSKLLAGMRKIRSQLRETMTSEQARSIIPNTSEFLPFRISLWENSTVGVIADLSRVEAILQRLGF